MLFKRLDFRIFLKVSKNVRRLDVVKMMKRSFFACVSVFIFPFFLSDAEQTGQKMGFNLNLSVDIGQVSGSAQNLTNHSVLTAKRWIALCSDGNQTTGNGKLDIKVSLSPQC